VYTTSRQSSSAYGCNRPKSSRRATALGSLSETWFSNLQSNTYKSIIFNLVKLTQIQSNWFKFNQIDSNSVKLTQIQSNWLKFNQIDSNLIKLTQMQSNWLKFRIIDSNSVKLTQIKCSFFNFSHFKSILFKWFILI
jgi:hypothetical protein